MDHERGRIGTPAPHGAGRLSAWTATAAGAARAAGELAASDALAATIEALDRYPLVAFGEEHRNEAQHALLRALVRDPSFPAVADDVVVEFGNARYQRLVDRYVNGARVPLGEVQKAWLQTTQRPTRVWAAPMYRQFFQTVRTVNRSLPRASRIRVVLGDPPIDWRKVRTQDDYERWIGRRTEHYISVVERQVLAKGHHALLIAGGAHLLRMPGEGQNETAVLERAHPGSVFTVFPFAGFVGDTDERRPLSERLRAEAPAPWLAPLRGTWLGDVPAEAAALWEPGTLADRADAFLYLGS